jgi:hypothetical protein
LRALATRRLKLQAVFKMSSPTVSDLQSISSIRFGRNLR